MAYQPKSYRKFLATSVTAAMVATVAAPFATPAQAAANFPDVPAGHWAADAIDYLVEKGALEGRPNGSFDPTASITRGEAAKILAITLGLEVDLNAKTDFADAANHWASPYIAAIQAQTQDVINGYENGTFRPNNNITRQEMAKMVVTAYGLELDAEADVSFNDNTGWGAEYVNVLASLGIVEGISEGTFSPNGLVTRAQTPVFVQRAEVPEVRVEVPTKTPAVVDLAVESVSAINPTTVELTGTALDTLEAAQLSLEGNKVVSVTANEAGDKATVVFEKAFVSGQEQVLNLTQAVEGENDLVTAFSFTYTLEVASAEVTTSRVDDNTAGQFLGFTINGGLPVSTNYLVESGYTVEFQSTNDTVFATPAAVATGELANSLSGKFAYKVVISKDDVTVESELKEVEVLDFATYLTAINEVTVDQGAVSVKSGKVTVQNGTVNVLATKATTLSGGTDNAPTVTYKSSNPAIASVDATTGIVTPIKAGSVTITASADDATVSVPLTVVSGAREATTVTATTNSVKLLEGKTQDVDFTVVDQYGDEFEGTLDVVSRDAAIADGTLATLTFVDGKATGTLSAIAKGNTVIDLKKGTTTLKSTTIAVSDDAVVASRKIETALPSADLTLDVVNGSTDTAVTLVWNQYNAGGFLIGPETALDTTYTVSSSDATVATATAEVDATTGLPTGNILVEGLKEGTAQVVIKEGSVTRATATITVTDSTPTITAVDFEEVEDVTTAGALNVQVLKAAGITLSSTDYTAEIDASGAIFVDVDGVDGYNVATDITLGEFTYAYSGDAADINTLGVSAGSVTATEVFAGANGTIVGIVTLEGVDGAFATTTINVKVPE